jgi:hypothetical protein
MRVGGEKGRRGGRDGQVKSAIIREVWEGETFVLPFGFCSACNSTRRFSIFFMRAWQAIDDRSYGRMACNC